MGVEVYADVVRRMRQVMDALEGWLATLPDGSMITPGHTQQELRDLHLVYDQAALALSALAHLGIVPSARGGILNQQQFRETVGLRVGVRAGVDAALAAEPQTELKVLVALPHGLPPHMEHVLQQEGGDLRAALIGVIASAHTHLVLASPFWDDQTVIELGDLLERRLQAGVQIELLGRPASREGGSAQGYAALAHRLLAYPGCHAFTWETPLADDPFGTQTFHFKCAIADQGEQAYFGSANFTLSSLRSRMELGALLHGEAAQTLSRIVAEVLRIAKPVDAL